MASSETAALMSEEGRALLTDSERAILAGEKEVKDNYRYKVESLVRNRVKKKFGDDVAVLREALPGVYDELVEEVCDDEHSDNGE